jgi:hypothetical protein
LLADLIACSLDWALVSNNSINSQIPETRETILINKKNLKIAYKIKAIPSTGTLAPKSRFVQSL